MITLRKKDLSTLPLIGVGIFFALFLLSTPVSASENETDLHYSVYLGGLYLGSIETEVRQGKSNYKIQSAARTNATFKWVLNWFAKGETEGLVSLYKFFPQQHQHKSTWNDNVRVVSMDYTNAGEVQVQKTDTREGPSSKLTPIDPASLTNTLDPMTAILTMTNRLEKGEGCKAELPIFDGHRRYDIMLSEKPARYFKPSRYSVFEGNAIGCKIDIVRKGGFPVKRNYDRDPNANQEVIVWVGAPIENGHVVPVRLRMETQFGMMEMHLDRYREGPMQLVSNNSK